MCQTLQDKIVLLKWILQKKVLKMRTGLGQGPIRFMIVVVNLWF